MPRELRWPFGPLGTGVCLFVGAGLLSLALAFPDGSVSKWLNDLARAGFGIVRYALPILMIGLGLAAWRPESIPPARVGRPAIVAWLTLIASMAAVAQAAGGNPSPTWVGAGGGAVGWALITAAGSLLGAASAVLVYLGVGIAALSVATGFGPIDFANALRRGATNVMQVLASERRTEAELEVPDRVRHRLASASAVPRGRSDDDSADLAIRAGSKVSEGGETGTPKPMVASTGVWHLPPLTLLNHGSAGDPMQADIEKKARAIEEALADFDVFARVVEVNPGPTVTQFGLRPGYRERRDKAGNVVRRDKIKVSEIVALQNDLALALAAPSIRIEAPVPGRQLVGIEVPNSTSTVVGLRDLLESEKFQRFSGRARLAVALGQDVSSETVCADLSKMPHLLIAGATGSGKSVCVNSIIASLLIQFTPDELRLLMVDPKRVELTGYNDIPHLLRPVVTEVDKVVSVLRWVTHEMDERYKRYEQVGCRNIDAYNRARLTRPDLPSMPYLVVIIDELADIMLMAADEIEPALCRLAQMARATGIHLVVATQRPSVDVITGLIKANFPTRIAFAVMSQVDSRTILDGVGAEKLLGRGDMLFLAADAPKPVRLQGTFVDDAEIEAVVHHWQAQGEPSYVEELVNVAAWSGETGEDEDLLGRAIEVARNHNRVSTSLLQRRLRIGYPRAARLMEVLEDRGIIGPQDGSRSREVFAQDLTEDGVDDQIDDPSFSRV